MKKNEIYEASAAVDKAVGTVNDVAGNTGLAALVAQYAPKVPAAIKTFGKKAFPVANAVYQASDAAKRAIAGDEVGATIAGASAIPVLSIPGMAVQAARDKVRTGSFSPTDDEIKTAAKKDKEAGGYWKARGSEYDPSYMPEGKVMKNRLQVAIIKEELTLKKCSMTEEQIRNTLFIYKDRQGNLFTESGRQIDHSRLDEVFNPFPVIGQGLKTGWNAVKTGGKWAAKNVPPAYRAVKSGIGKTASEIGDVYQGVKKGVGATADEIGNVYQGVKKVGTAVGNELVDVPASIIKKFKRTGQDIRTGTDATMDPAQRLTHTDNYNTAQNLKDLGQTEVKRAEAEIRRINQEIKNLEMQGKSSAELTQAQADLAKFIAWQEKNKLPFHQRHPIITGIGATAAGAVGADTALRYDADKKEFKGDPGSALGHVGRRAYDRAYDALLPEESGAEKLANQIFGRKQGPDGEQYVKMPNGRLGYGDPKTNKFYPLNGDKLGASEDYRSAFNAGQAPRPEVKPEVKPAVTTADKPAPAVTTADKPAADKPAADKPAAKTDVNPGYLDTSGFENPDKPAKPTNAGSDKVIAMQKKLKAAGYDIGTFGAAGDGIDGKWGNKTQAAYDAYKADKNLKRAGQPDAASLERERIAAQSNANQAPAGTNANKIDVKDLQKDYPRAAVVTEPVTRSTPWGGIQTPPNAIEKVIQAGQRRSQDLARIRSQSLEPTSGPALNTNSVPYAIDVKATADRDRVAALMKEELQDMLRLSGLRGK
jgi:hypothetical protein